MSESAVSRIDVVELEERGYTFIPDVVDSSDLEAFERNAGRFAALQAAELGIELRSEDPFIDVFTSSPVYRRTVYPLFERLSVFHTMSAKIAAFLEESGFLNWAGFEVPLIWPEARADTPSEELMTLPMHQDYNSTKCTRAWRMWVALRPADEHRGTMRIVPGSHRHGCLPHNLDDPLQPYVEEKHYATMTEEIIRVPAGTGVLCNPLVVHGSVPNRSARTKFTLLVQVQDLAAVASPEDPADPFRSFREVAAARDQGRRAASVSG